MEDKTKEQLMEEMESLRQKVAELKKEGAAHKKTVQALTESEEKYRVVVGSANETIIITQDGRIKFANPKATELVGYSKEELTSRAFVEFIHPDDREMVTERHLRRLKSEEFPHIYSFRIVDKAGNIIWAELNVALTTWEGRPATLNLLSDITERKKAIERLEEAEILKSSILAAIPHAVIGLHERRIIFANDGAEAVFGWKPGELIGKTTRVLYRSEEEYKQIGQHFYSALKHQRVYSEELSCRCQDGRDIICQLSASRIGERLEEKKIVVTCEDITERKKAEEALQKSEENFQSSLDSSPLGVRIVSAEGETLYVNQVLLDIWCYGSLEEM